jgi:ribonuclease E
VVEAPVVAEVAAPVVEAAPASALTENGRAPNDPREVRRRRKEAEAAAAAAAQAPAPVEHTASIVDANPGSVEDVAEHTQRPWKQSTSLNPRLIPSATKKPRLSDQAGLLCLPG